MQQAGIVVTLVEILEDGRENLGLFVGKRNPLVLRFEVPFPADAFEERRLTQDLFVRRKQPAFAPNHQGDDRGGERLLDGESLLERLLQFR